MARRKEKELIFKGKTYLVAYRKNLFKEVHIENIVEIHNIPPNSRTGRNVANKLVKILREGA
jgi:hypothetical protein